MYYKYILELLHIVNKCKEYIEENNICPIYPELDKDLSILYDYYNMLELMKYELDKHGEECGCRTLNLLVGDLIDYISKCKITIIAIDNKIRSLEIPSDTEDDKDNEIEEAYNMIDTYILNVTKDPDLMLNNIEDLSKALTYKTMLDVMTDNNMDVSGLLKNIIMDIYNFDSKIYEYNHNCLADPLLDRLI